MYSKSKRERKREREIERKERKKERKKESGREREKREKEKRERERNREKQQEREREMGGGRILKFLFFVSSYQSEFSQTSSKFTCEHFMRTISLSVSLSLCLCLCVSVSVCLSVCLSLSLSIYIYIYIYHIVKRIIYHIKFLFMQDESSSTMHLYVIYVSGLKGYCIKWNWVAMKKVWTILSVCIVGLYCRFECIHRSVFWNDWEGKREKQ